MPQAKAISSTALSSAALPGASPGARMNIGVPVSSRTASWLVDRAGVAYSVWDTSAAGSMKSSNVLVAVFAWWATCSVPGCGVTD